MSTTARRLISGYGTRLANTVATGTVSLVLMPFVVHRLGDRMFGIWALVSAIIGYYPLLELGLSTAVTRYLAGAMGQGHRERFNRVFNTALRLYAGLAVIVLIVTLVLASLARHFVRNTADAAVVSQVILILGLTAAVLFPTGVFGGALEAQLRFDRLAGFELLTLGLRTTLVVALLLSGHNVVALAWATLFATIPSTILTIRSAYKEVPFLSIESRYWDRGTARTLFSFSAFNLITHLANVLRFRVDTIVVAAFVSLSAVTHYRVAGVLAQYYFLFMAALLGMFTSVFSRQEGAYDFEAIRKTYSFASKICASVASFLTFGLIAWGKPFIARWMGTQYLDAFPVLVVLAVAFYVGHAQGPFISLLFGTSRHKFVALVTSLEAAANLVLSIVLVRRFGMVGVALGTLIPMLVSGAFIFPAYACRVAKIDYFEHLRGMARTLGAVAVALLAPVALGVAFVAPDYRNLFCVGLLSLVLYGAVLWVLLFSGGEARTLIMRAMRPGYAVKGSVD